MIINYLPIIAEIILLLGLIAAVALTLRHPLEYVAMGVVALLAAIGFLFGFPKSSYHAALIAIILYVALREYWSPTSRRIVLAALLFSLSTLAIYWLVRSDLSFGNKYTVPKLFPIWFLILLFARGKWAMSLAVCVILIDIWIQNQVAARGLMFGCFLTLFVLLSPAAIARRVSGPIMVASFTIYVLAFPIARLLGFQQAIYSSASNLQRAGMNNAALIDTISKPITMDENSIFASARPFSYSYDTIILTVHNLFLAFGLFNGLIAAVILIFSVYWIVSRMKARALIAVCLFAFLYILLGPDTAYTRIALMTICAAACLDRMPRRSLPAFERQSWLGFTQFSSMRR